MPREISAGIIIYKREKDRDGRVDTKYLLLYHGGGYWNFPKGKIEGGERSIQTALREAGEETGIPAGSLRLEKNFKVTDKFIYQREGEKIFKIVLFYLAQTSNPQVKISYEHEGFGWFLYNDAIRLIKHKNIKLILKRAHDYLRKKSLPGHSQNSQR